MSGLAVRRRWRWPLIVVLLVAVPVLEVWLLILFGRWVGVWPTVGVLVAEALVGAALVRHVGRRTWRSLSEALSHGTVPSTELVNAALVLCGGLLLMVPGLVTDLLGLVFLLPVTRPLARRLLTHAVARRLARLRVPGGPLTVRSDVIAGETVDAAPGSPGATVISGEILDR